MKAIIEFLIRKIKNDPNYAINSKYALIDYMIIINTRLFQIIRGYLLKIRINAEGVVFCGKGVDIKHKHKFFSKTGLVLEDNVYINSLSIMGIRLGRNVSIARDTVIVCTGVVSNIGQGLRVGNFSAIGAKSFIGCQGGVCIGDNVIIGPGLKIFSENHIYSNKDKLIRMQGEHRIGVKIEENCWIGANVTILDGVNIGCGSVIAAGSVVTKSLSENTVAAGVPAVKIKNRTC
jgi:acetyltransferase-like isoleucine patch superfamily enzyme